MEEAALRVIKHVEGSTARGVCGDSWGKEKLQVFQWKRRRQAASGAGKARQEQPRSPGSTQHLTWKLENLVWEGQDTQCQW